MDTDSARRGLRGQPGPAAKTGWHGRALTFGLRVAGAGLLIAAAAIHLDLYVTGYRSIPVVGGLFLLQVIVAFLAGAAVLVTGSRLAAAAGAVFALATLGGYLLSVRAGLFGFKEVRTTAGIAAGVVEVAAFAALAVTVIRPPSSGLAARWHVPGWRAAGGRVAGGRVARWPVPGWRVAAWLNGGAAGAVTAIGGVSVVALVLLGVAVAGAGGPPPAPPAPSAPSAPSGSVTLETATINGATVLTNGQGFTLYWFGPDTAARSVCTGVCAQYWPPVTGRPRAVSAIAGTLGTITRPDGSAQATYDGHPLYTYIGDTAPGQANGDNLNLNGGLWHEVTVPGGS